MVGRAAVVPKAAAAWVILFCSDVEVMLLCACLAAVRSVAGTSAANVICAPVAVTVARLLAQADVRAHPGSTVVPLHRLRSHMYASSQVDWMLSS